VIKKKMKGTIARKNGLPVNLVGKMQKKYKIQRRYKMDSHFHGNDIRGAGMNPVK